MTAWIPVKIKTQKRDPYPNQKMGIYKGEPYPHHTRAYDVLTFTDEEEAIKFFWKLQKEVEEKRASVGNV